MTPKYCVLQQLRSSGKQFGNSAFSPPGSGGVRAVLLLQNRLTGAERLCRRAAGGAWEFEKCAGHFLTALHEIRNDVCAMRIPTV